MAENSKEEKNIVILYEEGDAQTWADYIQKEFSEKGPKVGGVDIKNLNAIVSEIASLCSQYTVVVLLISPEMLETLETTSKQIAAYLGRHKNITVVKLYIESQLDTLTHKVLPKFPCHESWQMCQVTEANTENELRQTVSDILDLLQSAKQQAAKPKVRKSSGIINHVSPDTIRHVSAIFYLLFLFQFSVELFFIVISFTKKINKNNNTPSKFCLVVK